MRQKTIFSYISGISVALLTILLTVTACQPAGFLFTQDGEIECGGDGKAIILENNPDAADPTFEELMIFIEADRTDTRDYIKNGANAYVCSDFAEEVHNNAEAAGIRSGWVAIRFNGTDEGHAINAFETIDKGLVYIDCTNSQSAENSVSEIERWDTIAYIEEGKRYGIISIDQVLSTNFDSYMLEYDYYLECENAWQDFKTKLAEYNTEVDEYNQEIKGKVYKIGSPEERRISAWKNELIKEEKILEKMENTLGNYWYESEFSSYTVRDILIHW